MPSFILIRPTVWPHYTNVTDRTDRQNRTDRQDRTTVGLHRANRFTKGCPKTSGQTSKCYVIIIMQIFIALGTIVLYYSMRCIISVVFGRPFVKRFTLSYWTVVLFVCL